METASSRNRIKRKTNNKFMSTNHYCAHGKGYDKKTAMINSLENCINQVSQRLRSKSIKVDSEWLSECVDHFYTENPQINILELFNSTMEQWQLSDLADIGVPCLPNSISNKDDGNTTTTATNQSVNSSSGVLIHLNDIYPVQILYVLDIAESAYDQIRNLYNLKLDQTETEKQETNKSNNNTKKRRMLKLIVTDGFKTVTALEHFPIPCLSTKIMPGCKVLLKGPMRYINKTILLKPNNIEILGGEVAKYEIDNAYENVLLRHLNRPLNPNPKTEYPEIVVVEQKPPSKIPDEMTSTFGTAATTGISVRSTPTSTGQIEDDLFADDDLLLNVEFDEEMIPATAAYLPTATTVTASNIAETRRDNTSHLPNRPPQPPPPPPTVEKTSMRNSFLLNNDDDDDDDLLFEHLVNQDQQNIIDLANDDDEYNEEICDNDILPDEKIIFNEPSTLVERNNKYKEKNNIEDKRILSPSPPSSPLAIQPSQQQQQEQEQHASSSDTVIEITEDDCTNENYKFQINNCNLVTIDQLCLLQLADEIENGKEFIIKAEIDNVFKKLQIKNSNWKIGVWLRDNISEQMLQIQIKNDVLNEISGFAASELESMRKQIKERPQIIDDITDLLVKLKVNLEQLYCFMKIKYPSCVGGDGTIGSSGGNDQFNTSSASSPSTSSGNANNGGDTTISSGQFPVLIEIIKITPKLEKLWEDKLKSENIVKN